ncbi:hypothetical protein ACU686_08375 [Yinghuangia aomiensis]
MPSPKPRAHPTPTGGCAVLPLESLRFGAHELLQLGAEAEVLGPPELRRAVAAQARAVAAMYEDGEDGEDGEGGEGGEGAAHDEAVGADTADEAAERRA